jgi:transposase InsO family protein
MFNKSNVYQCFLNEKQFDSIIKQFQSDNGGEYTSNQFKHYLSQNGIFHRLTCLHTSQQNGIAERKHRHVVKLGLTLLAQLGLPSKHWIDSFLTSVYLIDRLPTPVLQNETSFSNSLVNLL